MKIHNRQDLNTEIKYLVLENLYFKVNFYGASPLLTYARVIKVKLWQ